MAEKTSSARSERLTAVKGMNDILPPDSARWEWFEQHVRDTMAAFAYRTIRTPIVEYTPLFVKGTGETTDIVEKEMYSFEDRLNGEQLTLRPENTPGVVRAAIEHNLTYEGPKRLYYMGPMFRHERPQRGRYRQFYQLGVEALGFAGPEADAEQMPEWKKTHPGVEAMNVAVMGCIVNGPGESKHANIGISLPGTGESPAAPVFVDGQKVATLRGERIVDEFKTIVLNYVQKNYGKEAETI